MKKIIMVLCLTLTSLISSVYAYNPNSISAKYFRGEISQNDYLDATCPRSQYVGPQQIYIKKSFQEEYGNKANSYPSSFDSYLR